MDSNTQIYLKITENRSRIMATIVAMTRDFNVAEDLFQETVLEVIKHADRFDKTRQFSPWACGIARNVVRQFWRDHKLQPVAVEQDALASLAEIASEPYEGELKHDDLQALEQCLGNLPVTMQKLIILRYGHNCKGTELAQRASIKQGAIRTTLLRLRNKLKTCILSKRSQTTEEVML